MKTLCSRRWIVMCVVAGGLCTAVFGFRGRLFPVAASYLDVGGRPRTSEFVMVLPGDLKTRPFVAAGMVRHGLARTVIVPTSEPSPLVQDSIIPSHDEAVRRILNIRGVSNDQIILLQVETGSTWNDAESLRDFLVDHQSAEVAIVSSDYHTRRTRWVFRRVLKERYDDVYFVSAPTDYIPPQHWWQSEIGLRTYLAEYSKLLVYWVRYGEPIFWSLVIGIWVIAVLALRRSSRKKKQPDTTPPNGRR